jgi:hypothetical protein
MEHIYKELYCENFPHMLVNNALLEFYGNFTTDLSANFLTVHTITIFNYFENNFYKQWAAPREKVFLLNLFQVFHYAWKKMQNTGMRCGSTISRITRAAAV